MKAALKAGALYFAVVFAAGFVLGTLRTLLVAPRLGDTPAVLLELPAMLTASWLACGWALRRFGVSWNWERRLAMGFTAFALLMAAELLLSLLAFGRTVGEHFAAYGTWSAGLGLAAQLVFAVLPLLREPGRTVPFAPLV